MEKPERVKVSFEDPDVMDRVQATIIMVVDASIKRLETLGYERGVKGKGIEIAPSDDGLPIFVKLNGDVVFIVREYIDGKNGLTISGEWQRDVPPKPRKRGFWAWLFRRK